MRAGPMHMQHTIAARGKFGIVRHQDQRGAAVALSAKQ